MQSRNYISFTLKAIALSPRAYSLVQGTIYSNILPIAEYNCTVIYCLLQGTIVQ
jgi:hypothetical protein